MGEDKRERVTTILDDYVSFGAQTKNRFSYLHTTVRSCTRQRQGSSGTLIGKSLRSKRRDRKEREESDWE